MLMNTNTAPTAPSTDADVMMFNVRGKTLEEVARAGYTLDQLAATATVDYDDVRDSR